MKALRILGRRVIDGYAFRKDARAFNAFLGTVPLSAFSQTDNGRRAAIVVSPWHYTAVPWFSICLAVLYRARGYQTTLIWDDLPFSDVGQLADQNRFIGKILKKLPKTVPVIRLSALAPATLSSSDKNEINRLTELNAASKFRSSILGEDSLPYREQVNTAFGEALARINAIFSGNGKFDHIVVPGGIYGDSGLFIWAAQKTGVRVATYDSGPGNVWIGVDDIAAHQMDVAKMFGPASFANELMRWRQPMLAKANEELNLRIHGKDRYKFQIHPYSEEKSHHWDLLMPLNIDWDAAALGKHNYFQNPFEWIVETVRFVLDHTEATIAVRQHPDERHRIYKCHHDLKAELEKRFPAHPRLRFFAAEEKVNTYNLLENCKVLLPMTSTLGIEAAALGKHVIIESNAYYSELSFVQKPRTRKAYFTAIKETLARTDSLPDAKREEALLCYFFAQIANYIWTGFTPTNVDYAKWSLKNFTEINEDPCVRSMMDSLTEARPAILWRTSQIFSAG